MKVSEVKDCFLSIQIMVDACIYHDMPITHQNIVLSFIVDVNNFTCNMFPNLLDILVVKIFVSSSLFFLGEKIYGKIEMNDVQRMGDHLQVSLEKVYLCSGKDGYIPTFDPENGQYGCLSQSENLEYHVKVIVSTHV